MDLVIQHAIMHYLDPDSNDTKFVSREIEFVGEVGEAVLGILCRLITLSLDGSDTYAEDSGQSETLSACWHILSTPDSFIEKSHQMAEGLSNAMRGKGNVKKGDMLIALASDVVGPMVVILKLEQLQEFQVRYIPQDDGTFAVKLELNEGVVSSREVPQKCAFIREPSATYGYHARLHDNQVREKESAAKFFYQEFLGCRLLTTPAKRTLNFCNSAEAWRRENAVYLPQQGIVTFTRALIQHLRSGEVSFKAFAESALAGAQNSEWSVNGLAEQVQNGVYAKEMQRGEFVKSSFTPDPATIDKVLQSVNLTLSNGLRLAGPTDAMLKVFDSLDADGGNEVGHLLFKVPSSSVERNF